MMRDDADALLRIVARAAPPHERSRGAWCRPLAEASSERVENRLEEWIQTASGGDRARFRLYLEAVGTTEEALRRGLVDVEVHDPRRLPAWAKTFLRLMESFRRAPTAPPYPAASGGEPEPFEELLRPFVEIGYEELAGAIGDCGQSVGEDARREMLDDLAKGLLSAFVHTFDVELSVQASASRLLRLKAGSGAARLETGFAGWLRRLERYPVLAYLIGVVYGNWLDASREFLHRLAADRELVEQRMFAGEPLGELVSFSGRAGDLHNHGRAVNLLRFESGARLVYKPKDLRVSAAFLDLVAWLNDAGAQPPLHVRTILCTDGYAWEEWIEPAPCRTREQVRRFYLRMGANLRLLQLLGARDFWLDNLIACGEYPVFVDLETVVHQWPELPATMTSAERRAFRRLQESAVPIGAVAQCVPVGRGARAEDLGALTPPREFRTPFKFAYSEAMRELLAPSLDADANIRWQKSDYVPRLNGVPANAARHLDDVLAGYRAMNDALRASRTALLSPDSPLHALARLPIRHIQRDTWSCLRIVNDSVRTPLLVDAVRRETFFLGLMKPALSGRRPDDDMVKIIDREIHSLRELDVPFFVTVPDGDSLLSADGEPIARHFEGRAWDRVVERVAALGDSPVDEDFDFIRSTFACGPHRAERGSRRIDPVVDRSDPEDWLTEAVSLADLVLDQGIWGEDADLAWLGLTYHPDIDMRAVEVLRPDVLTGTCGLSVMFADLHAETGLDRFGVAARGGLATTVRALRDGHPLLDLLDREPDATPLVCGGYYGIGSQLFGLRRCARSLRSAELERAMSEYLALLPVARLGERAPVDLISGLAGAILSIVPAEGGGMTEEAARIAGALAGHLVDRFGDGPAPSSPYPTGAETLRHLPAKDAGISMCLSRLLRQVPEPWPGPDRMRLERLLAGLRSSPRARSPGNRRRWSSARLLDALDVSLSLHRVTGEEVHYRHALRAARELRWHRRATGSWFPDSFAADRFNLSALIGLGAIAHGFARLARPRQVLSIRLLE